MAYLMKSYMGHTVQKKQKLLNRVCRIREQPDAIEHALEDEHGYVSVLQQITSCRGVMNGLLAGVLEDHIRTHLTEANTKRGHASDNAKNQLIEVVHSYLE